MPLLSILLPQEGKQDTGAHMTYGLNDHSLEQIQVNNNIWKFIVLRVKMDCFSPSQLLLLTIFSKRDLQM